MNIVPQNEIELRIEKLISAIGKKGIDSVLILDRINLFYFSGTCIQGILYVNQEGKCILFVMGDVNRASYESSIEEIYPISGTNELSKFVRTNRLGLELDFIPAKMYFKYSRLFSEAEIVDISNIIKEIRMIKSPYEISLLDKAGLLGKRMFEYIKNLIKPGKTELELAGEIEAFLRKEGHQGIVRIRSFNHEVFYGHLMSGYAASAPGHSPGPTGGVGPNPACPQGSGKKIILDNEPILIDYTTTYMGYVVDQARIFSIGRLSEKFYRVHELALDIQELFIHKARPGVPIKELFLSAIEKVKKADIKDAYFMGYPRGVPFIGHGVGLQLDEWPLVSASSPYNLERGMVFALEPKFILPGKGTVGIENSWVVTEDGIRRFTDFPDEIIHIK